MRNRSRVESGVKCEVRLAHCAILARDRGVASGRRSGLRSINRFSQTYALADTNPMPCRKEFVWILNSRIDQGKIRGKLYTSTWIP